MTTLNCGRILVVTLLFAVASLFLTVACSRGISKAEPKPKLPAAEYRVDDSPNSTPYDPWHYDRVLRDLEADRIALSGTISKRRPKPSVPGSWLKPATS
jgi:hypothetical protein